MSPSRPKANVSPWYILHVIVVALIGLYGYIFNYMLVPDSYNPYLYIFLFYLTVEIIIFAHELAHGLAGLRQGLHWESYYVGFTKFSVQLEDTPNAYRSNRKQIAISLVGPFAGIITAAILITVPLLFGQHWTNPFTLPAAIAVFDNLLVLTPCQRNSDGRKLLKATWRTLRGKGHEHFYYPEHPIQIDKQPAQQKQRL